MTEESTALTVQEEVKDSPVQAEEINNIFNLPAEQFDKSLALFDRNRKKFLEWVAHDLIDKVHYNIIKGKKSLSKAGAEEVANRLQVTSAQIVIDEDTLRMAGEPEGILFYRCDLYRGSVVVATGRGVRNIKQDSGDWNKAVKMAQKSSYVDAAIRLGGMSQIYTQDIEDMDLEGRRDKPEQEPVEERRNFDPKGDPEDKPQNNGYDVTQDTRPITDAQHRKLCAEMDDKTMTKEDRTELLKKTTALDSSKDLQRLHMDKMLKAIEEWGPEDQDKGTVEDDPGFDPRYDLD